MDLKSHDYIISKFKYIEFFIWNLNFRFLTVAACLVPPAQCQARNSNQDVYDLSSLRIEVRIKQINFINYILAYFLTKNIKPKAISSRFKRFFYLLKIKSGEVCLAYIFIFPSTLKLHHKLQDFFVFKLFFIY